MTDAASLAQALLRDHRDSIDRLDAILVYTLAERFKQTQRLERLSQEADLDPDFARKFLSFIISEVIRHHENLQK